LDSLKRKIEGWFLGGRLPDKLLPVIDNDFAQFSGTD